MEKYAIQIRITGRVQGVGYRAAARQKAVSLSLTGWVRNRPDGSVEAFAQGGQGALDALVAWCGDGPPAAKVAEVVVEPAPLDASHTEFCVRA